jgi:hypothetical protein
VPSSSNVWCHGAPPLRKATLFHDGRSALCLDAAGAACVWDLLAAPPCVTERFSLSSVLAEVDADADGVETKPGTSTNGDSKAIGQAAKVTSNPISSATSTVSANVRADACQHAPAETASVLEGFNALLARLQRRVPHCGRGLFVPPWCSLDLRLGALLVQIDPSAASFSVEAFAENVMSADELRTTIGANDRVVAAYAPASASAAVTIDAAIPSSAREVDGNDEDDKDNSITDDDDKTLRRRRRTRVALVDVFLRHVLADFIAYRHGTRRWAAERQRLAKAAAAIVHDARMAASAATTDADQEQSLARPAGAQDGDVGATASPAPDAVPASTPVAAASDTRQPSAALDAGVNPHDKISTV